MKLFRRTALFVVALSAVITPSSVHAQEKKVGPTNKSCQAFVREFYDWYLPKARSPHVDSLSFALKERRSAFSATLIKRIEAADRLARRNREPGLDFDWILNTQDPGDSGDPGYLVRDSSLHGGVCRAAISRQQPDGTNIVVVPILKFENGRWRFVNFYYPASEYPQPNNLLSLIRLYISSGTDYRNKR